MATPSLERIGLGLLWAAAAGVPAGVAIGLYGILRRATHAPFQFLRMISPLAWMPIAVLAFGSRDSAIIFLIAIAAVWQVLFSTAQGVRRIDPVWFKVARNLGANGPQMLRRIILPAIGQDIFAGIRLASAWHGSSWRLPNTWASPAVSAMPSTMRATRSKTTRWRRWWWLSA